MTILSALIVIGALLTATVSYAQVESAAPTFQPSEKGETAGGGSRGAVTPSSTDADPVERKNSREWSDDREGTPIDQKNAAAWKALIKASECVFNTHPELGRFKYYPSILKVASACEGSREPLYECIGFVYCTNHVTPFFVNHAVCWSKDGAHCPSAKECALATYFNSTFTTRDTSYPVFQDDESSGAAK